MYLHPGQYVHPAASTRLLCSGELSLLPAIDSFLFCLPDCQPVRFRTCKTIDVVKEEREKVSRTQQRYRERRYHADELVARILGAVTLPVTRLMRTRWIQK